MNWVTPVQKLGTMCTTTPFKQNLQNRYRGVMKEMKIVGQISTPEEAKQIESIAKAFVTANRARTLGMQTRGV